MIFNVVQGLGFNCPSHFFLVLAAAGEEKALMLQVIQSAPNLHGPYLTHLGLGFRVQGLGLHTPWDIEGL